MTGRRLPAAERLEAKLVLSPTGCLEFSGSRDSRWGYGRIGVDGFVMLSHRLAWELANGPIPPGLDVLHHCDNPPCCQTEPTAGYPDGHLFLGTNADNVADKIAKGRDQNQQKTYCKWGHLYDEVNTYVRVTKSGFGRGCRICMRDACARWRAAGGGRHL